MPVHNLKHKQLYERFNAQKEPKPTRANFINRVHNLWRKKHKAIWVVKATKRQKTKNEVGENGRVCNKCITYKTRDQYSKTTATKTWYTTRCKECRNKAKYEYRKKNREHYLQLRSKRRRLPIGTRVMFYNPLNTYTVVDYQYKKWHLLQDDWGMYTRLDTCAGNPWYRKYKIVDKE